MFTSFIQEFQLDRIFIYREQLRANCLINQPRLDVDMSHLISYDDVLSNRLSSEPGEMIPLVSVPRYCETS